MMLQEHTSLRQSKSTMQAYYLIITTMDVMAREKKEMIGKSQELLRELLLAAKVSENHLKIFLENNLNKVLSLLIFGVINIAHLVCVECASNSFPLWNSACFWMRKSRMRLINHK